MTLVRDNELNASSRRWLVKGYFRVTDITRRAFKLLLMRLKPQYVRRSRHSSRCTASKGRLVRSIGLATPDYTGLNRHVKTTFTHILNECGPH
jgi:hypothetical protein